MEASLGRKNIKITSSFRLRSPSLNSVRLRRIFDIFDGNNDGVITMEELSHALNRLGMEIEAAEVESMVKCYVQPGNEGLQYQDFEALHRSLNDTIIGKGEQLEAAPAEGEDDSDLTEAFKVFDEDGDGYISASELQTVLSKLGLPEAKEIHTVEMMIESVDRNHDGRVDFFEFKDMMSSVLFHTTY